MAKMWIWNSMATRKRSPSDGFLENGLALLKGYLEERGHAIKVIDWQKNKFYDGLCPAWLRSLNRISTIFMFWLEKKGTLYAKLYFFVFHLLQELVSVVRKHRMKIALRELGDKIIKSGIKIFGVKVWYGEAFLWADWLANYIKKKDSSIVLVAGGFHVTLYEDDLLKNSVFDLGVVSEGERALEILLDIVDKNEAVWDKNRVLNDIKEKIEAAELKNMVYRDKGAIKVSPRYTPNMAQKSLPKFEEDSIDGKLKIHVLLDSLGCPWGKCNFCVHSHFYPRFYPRPVEDIVNEMEYMIKKGIGLFRFAGSETPPSFGVRIAQAILNKGLKVKYSIGCRAVRGIGASEDIFRSTVGHFEVMLTSGLLAVFMGGESGNDTINEKVMRKGVARQDIIKTAQAFKEARDRTGVRAYWCLALIYPTPLVEGISMDTVFKDDLKLIEDAIPDSVVVSPCTPFKQTAWYRKPEDFGFCIPSDFIGRMMKYEYVLYKPPSLWPSLGEISIAGLSFKEFLGECGRLRKAAEGKGIPSDLTDEYFLMVGGGGYSGKKGLERFKKDTSIDLVSSDYRNIKKITELTNTYSQEIAKSNFLTK